MAEHAATRLVQYKVAKRFVFGDKTRLVPNGRAVRRGNATDDDVTDLAFSMAGDHVDDFR